MLDRFSESDLLGYIEETLAPEAMAAMAERLEQEPGLAAAVERLRSDRSALRSASDPAPLDFVAEIEPQLARPMLMDLPGTAASPGAYRRRHRRERRRLFARRAVAAALLMVPAAAVAIWFTASGGLGDGDPVIDGVAIAAETETAEVLPVPAPPVVVVAPGDEAVAAPADTVVHHWGPLPPDAPGRDRTADRTAPADAAGVKGGPVTAPFAVVLHAADVAAVEASLASLAREFEPEVAGAPGPAVSTLALVRNFNMTEARHIVDQYLLGGGGEEGPAAFTSMDARPAARPDRVRDRELETQLRRLRERRAGDPEVAMSQVLLGPADLGPGYAHQLELSRRGASHTLTIPASRLNELLQRLREGEGDFEVTGLRLLPPEGPDAGAALPPDAPPPAFEAWIEVIRRADAFRGELREALGDDLDGAVHVPVVIERD